MNIASDTWATVLSGYVIPPYQISASGKTDLYNRLLKTTLKAVSGRAFKYWEINLAKGT